MHRNRVVHGPCPAAAKRPARIAGAVATMATSRALHVLWLCCFMMTKAAAQPSGGRSTFTAYICPDASLLGSQQQTQHANSDSAFTIPAEGGGLYDAGLVQSVANLTANTVNGVIPASKAQYLEANNQLKQAQAELSMLSNETQTLTADNQQLQTALTNVINKVNALTPVRRLHDCHVFLYVWQCPTTIRAGNQGLQHAPTGLQWYKWGSRPQRLERDSW